jgi:hypothetical protein
MAERKHNYVVGYPGDRQVAYGWRHFAKGAMMRLDDWCEPMTLLQAKRYVKKLRNPSGAIYKLVRVK